jgi:hypothetical protein
LPATTDAPCARCGEQHTYTTKDGWYASNSEPRHPFTPRNEGEEMQVHIGNSATLDGFHSALFGALHACDYCGAIVDRPDLELHSGACHPKEAA